MDVGCRVLVLGCVLVLGGLFLGGASVVGVSEAAVATQDDQLRPSADEIRYEIALHGNGSATWTVEYRYRLGDNESVDWEELEADVDRQPDAYVDGERMDWADALAEAENATGREMYASGFSVETDESTTPPDYGYLRFTFHWKSFAHVEVNRIEAGDALVDFDLDDRTQLIVSWPDSYNDSSVEPAPDDRRETAVLWNGDETDFLDDEPRIEVIETGDSPVEEPEDPERILPIPWLAAAGVAVIAAVGVAGWWMRREDGADARSASAANAAEGAPAERERPPPELLSNEERVLRLLEERGGRIKQQEVVSELDWTEAKTSQVVGDLREDDEIEVFRIGRENVLALPEDEE